MYVTLRPYQTQHPSRDVHDIVDPTRIHNVLITESLEIAPFDRAHAIFY